MKRMVMFGMLLVMLASIGASFAPANADPHKDRFRKDCATGARKC